MRDGIAGVAFGRNNAQCAFIGDLPPDLGTAISLVGYDRERWFIPVQKGVHHLTVMDIAARYCDPQRSAMHIYCCMNFARATAS